MGTLFDQLHAYSRSDFYGFHMPGHKRNINLFGTAVPYQIDITEIDGFDDLHHASGILKEAQERAARLYHAEESHFLINGSTVGILSAILGVTKKGDTVLVARNCHKSVYHAIYLNELNPIYLYPEVCEDTCLNKGICAKAVCEALSHHKEVRAVVLVSPTYDGVLSDIAQIAEVVHSSEIPLIVDEAHGAHFGFHPYFPENSNILGADLVIHSLHKTLPSLTQTALLHMNGTLVDREGVREYLHMLQSSSPSYLLMASMDACMELMEQKGDVLFKEYALLLEEMRGRLLKLQVIDLLETNAFDRSKLVLSVRRAGITGQELYERLLKDYHIQVEMAAGTYALAMTSVGDTREGMERLVRALVQMDEELGSLELGSHEQSKGHHLLMQGLPRLEKQYNSAWIKAHRMDQKRKRVLWAESVGAVSTEQVYLYPPGIPLIVPGEKVSEEAADMLQWYKDMGLSIEGLKEEGHIEVLTDE